MVGGRLGSNSRRMYRGEVEENEKVGVYDEHSNVTMGGLAMETLPPTSLIVCMYCQDDSELF